MSTRPFAVVTGGSNGIGLELARDLGRRGHDLLIVAEDTAGLGRAAQVLRRHGASVETHVADLATADGVDSLVGKLRHRDVDVLCVNAGVGQGGAFTETDLDSELRMIDLNCRGAVQLAKPVARAMQARGRGRILFTSSIAATMPGTFEAVYSATKVFLRWFSGALREELKDSGVTVTALMPSTTATNFFRRAGMMNTRAGTGSKDDAAEVARAGLDGLFAGKDRVVPTTKNKAMAFIADHLPDSVGARMHRGLTEPGSDKSTGIAPALIGIAVVGAGALLLTRRDRTDGEDRAETQTYGGDRSRYRAS